MIMKFKQAIYLFFLFSRYYVYILNNLIKKLGLHLLVTFTFTEAHPN